MSPPNAFAISALDNSFSIVGREHTVSQHTVLPSAASIAFFQFFFPVIFLKSLATHLTIVYSFRFLLSTNKRHYFFQQRFIRLFVISIFMIGIAQPISCSRRVRLPRLKRSMDLRNSPSCIKCCTFSFVTPPPQSSSI